MQPAARRPRPLRNYSDAMRLISINNEMRTAKVVVATPEGLPGDFASPWGSETQPDEAGLMSAQIADDRRVSVLWLRPRDFARPAQAPRDDEFEDMRRKRHRPADPSQPPRRSRPQDHLMTDVTATTAAPGRAKAAPARQPEGFRARLALRFCRWCRCCWPCSGALLVVHLCCRRC